MKPINAIFSAFTKWTTRSPKKNKHEDHISGLPVEILFEINRFLKEKDILNLGATSQLFNELSAELIYKHIDIFKIIHLPFEKAWHTIRQFRKTENYRTLENEFKTNRSKMSHGDLAVYLLTTNDLSILKTEKDILSQLIDYYTKLGDDIVVAPAPNHISQDDITKRATAYKNYSALVTCLKATAYYIELCDMTTAEHSNKTISAFDNMRIKFRESFLRAKEEGITFLNFAGLSINLEFFNCDLKYCNIENSTIDSAAIMPRAGQKKNPSKKSPVPIEYSLNSSILYAHVSHTIFFQIGMPFSQKSATHINNMLTLLKELATNWDCGNSNYCRAKIATMLATNFVQCVRTKLKETENTHDFIGYTLPLIKTMAQHDLFAFNKHLRFFDATVIELGKRILNHFYEELNIVLKSLGKSASKDDRRYIKL